MKKKVEKENDLKSMPIAK